MVQSDRFVNKVYKKIIKINHKLKILKNIKNGPKWWICKQSVQEIHQNKLSSETGKTHKNWPNINNKFENLETKPMKYENVSLLIP